MWHIQTWSRVAQPCCRRLGPRTGFVLCVALRVFVHLCSGCCIWSLVSLVANAAEARGYAPQSEAVPSVPANSYHSKVYLCGAHALTGGRHGGAVCAPAAALAGARPQDGRQQRARLLLREPVVALQQPAHGNRVASQQSTWSHPARVPVSPSSDLQAPRGPFAWWIRPTSPSPSGCFLSIFESAPRGPSQSFCVPPSQAFMRHHT